MKEKIKRYIIWFVMITMIVLSWSACTPPGDPGTDTPIVTSPPSTESLIPDENLRAVILVTLGALGHPQKITESSLALITHLYARGSQITSLTGINYLVNLVELDLSENSINDISPLGSIDSFGELALKNLIYLNLSGNPDCAENPNFWGIVTKLTSLQELDLSYLGISSLAYDIGIDSLTSLLELNLAYNHLSDIFTLSSLTKLRSLDLSANSSISNFSALSLIKTLETLALRNTSVTDLSFINVLPNITWLDVSHTSILAISNFSEESGAEHYILCPNLKYIYLKGCRLLNYLKLSNIETIDLTECTGLKTLAITNSSITDFSFISDLTKLNKLNLSYSSITDIPDLSALTALNDLDLHYCPVTDISALGALTTLTYIDLSYSHVWDLSPLVNNAYIGNVTKIILSPADTQWPVEHQSAYTDAINKLLEHGALVTMVTPTIP